MSLGHFGFPKSKESKGKLQIFFMFTTKATLKPENKLGTPGESRHPETGQGLEQTSIRVHIPVE